MTGKVDPPSAKKSKAVVVEAVAAPVASPRLVDDANDENDRPSTAGGGEEVSREEMEQQQQAVFRTPTRAPKKKGPKKRAQAKAKDGEEENGVEDEEKEEQEALFRTPTPVAKKKGGKKRGTLTPSSSSKKRKMSEKEREQPDEEDAASNTSVSVASLDASLSSMGASPAPSNSTLSDEPRPLTDPRCEDDSPVKRFRLLSRKYARLMQERGTLNARIDMKYPELAKVSEFGEGPFVYTSNRRRADIEKEKAATAADIAAGKTTRAAREKEAAKDRHRLYDINVKHVNAVKAWMKEELAVIEKIKKDAEAAAAAQAMAE